MRRLLKMTGLTAVAVVAGVAVASVYAYLNAPGPIFVSARQSARQARIGHPIPITLLLRLPWGYDRSLLTPTLIPESEDLVLVDAAWRPAGWGLGYADWELVCTLKAMDATEYAGSIKLSLPDAKDVSVDIEPIKAASEAHVGENPEIRLAGPAAPADERGTEIALSVMIGVLAALVIAGILFLLLRGERKPAPTAADTAIAVLNRLADSPPADPEVFYQRLTDAVRAYVSATWEIPASTQTTRELLMTLEADETIAPLPLRDLIREFLFRADLVKYGGEETDIEGMQYSREIAERLVRESEEAIKIGARQ